jgi:hypothetical protein
MLHDDSFPVLSFAQDANEFDISRHRASVAAELARVQADDSRAIAQAGAALEAIRSQPAASLLDASQFRLTRGKRA